MNVTQVIPNFLGGISQQPDYDKEPGTLRDIKNAYPDLTYGLQKRKGSRWEYDLDTEQNLIDSHWLFFRDPNDVPYFAAVIPPTSNRAGRVRVWSAIDGTEQTVTGNFDYIERNDKGPVLTRQSYKTAEINQVVVVVNRHVQVSETSTTTAGTLAGTVTTVAELPEIGSAGDIYFVTNGTSDKDDFYVTWEDAWVETVKPGIIDGIDPTTMPHALIKTDTGFEFTPVPYVGREVGNEETNQHPSFVGAYIENVFFYLNRLGFLSRNNLVLSQPIRPDADPAQLQPPKFYRISTLTQSPADPVDVNASSVRPITLRSVQPTYQGLLLFADGEQFTLFSDQGIITPQTAHIKSMSTYELYGDVNAVELGDNHYFISRTLRHTRVFRMVPRGEAQNPIVTEVSKLITDYIPNDIGFMSANTQNSFVILSCTNRNTLYFYRTYVENEEQLLNAWYTWELQGKVQASLVIEDNMYSITCQSGRCSVSSIPLNTVPEEDILTNIKGVSIGPYLDLWVGQQRLNISPVISETNNKGEVIYRDIEVTLPSNYPSTITGRTPCAIVTKDELNRLTLSNTDVGAVFPVEESSGKWIIKGTFDSSNLPYFVVGYRFDYELAFPNYFVMGERGSDYTAHLNINRYRFIFKEGAEVQYMLQSFGRNDMKDPDDFTIVKPQPDPQYYYSDSAPVYNEVSLILPIHQRNTYFNMKIYSDSPFPVTLNKLMWEGSYNLRYYRRV